MRLLPDERHPRPGGHELPREPRTGHAAADDHDAPPLDGGGSGRSCGYGDGRAHSIHPAPTPLPRRIPPVSRTQHCPQHRWPDAVSDGGQRGTARRLQRVLRTTRTTFPDIQDAASTKLLRLRKEMAA
ncbi:hypothetical protein GCM10009802_55600 [Streptomyces synnematoformans]|uniref:Transposase n=1 Tax=Streptomyces synnematoformans TaxID=415721 RepID=A0ABP4KA38_9ACTN